LKKIYFASDFHLGFPDKLTSLEREKRIVKWLDSIFDDCAELFIVGDIFDFWFEYKQVVPKGFVRFIAKIASFTDAGIPVHIFHGNHDLWQFGYFEQELGVKVYAKPIIREIQNKRFYIGHGDGLGPGQIKFKFILWIYRNPLCQKLFGILHPRIGISLANWLSYRSKAKTFDGNFKFLGEEEFLIKHARLVLEKDNIDYFIFGHRHLPQIYELSAKSKYVNLGDWIEYNSYVVYDGDHLQLQKFE